MFTFLGYFDLIMICAVTTCTVKLGMEEGPATEFTGENRDAVQYSCTWKL